MRSDADPFAAASFHQRVQRLVRTHGEFTKNPNYHESRQLVVGDIVITEITAKAGGYGVHVYRQDDNVYSYSNRDGRSEIRFSYDAVEHVRKTLEQAFVLDAIADV